MNPVELNNSRQSKTQSRLSGIIRTASAACWFGVAAWVVWIAATRWSAVPAAFQEKMTEAIDSEIEHGVAMFVILEAIPPPPPLPPPPKGMAWRMNSTVLVDNVISGVWTPATRPGLRHLIEYIASPEVESALSRLTEIQLDAWRGYVRLNGAMAGGRTVRSASRLLAARARWHFAEYGDLDSALADLDLIHRLAGCGYRAGDLLPGLVASACESLADWELRKLSQEYPLTRAQATAVAAMLWERSLDPRDTWRKTTKASSDAWRSMMDHAYTEDEHGNGWFILSPSANVLKSRKMGAARTGAWNVFSPLFNSRNVVAAKIEGIKNLYMKATDLPYVEARELLHAAESHSPFSILDGPLAIGYSSSLLSSLHGQSFQQAADVRATIIAAALSAYRHDNGRYPESLSSLAGDYLGAVPNDPFVNRAFRYERTADDKYSLYSVWRNAVDDGGSGPFNQKNGGDQQERKDDREYFRPRGEPYNEPTLEKLAP